VEDRLEAELAVGGHGEAVAELEGLSLEHPLRERLRWLHMLALYRSGRQAEALRAYERTRDFLAEELGIDPSPALKDLHRRILQQDPELNLVVGPEVELLAFVFTDIEDSTVLWELHGEVMAEAVAAHEQILAAAVKDAGGRVVNRIGQAKLARPASCAARQM
jgi:class 3 adenylate cyclase